MLIGWHAPTYVHQLFQRPVSLLICKHHIQMAGRLFWKHMWNLNNIVRWLQIEICLFASRSLQQTFIWMRISVLFSCWNHHRNESETLPDKQKHDCWNIFAHVATRMLDKSTKMKGPGKPPAASGHLTCSFYHHWGPIPLTAWLRVSSLLHLTNNRQILN